MKKNILLLGGLGFIGRNIIEELIDDYNLIIFDHHKLSEKYDFKYFSGDFTKKEDLEKVFDNKIDLVIHSISTTIPSSNNIIGDINSNLMSSINLLELMIKHSVPKIIFISSGGTVYGLIGDKARVDENYPTNPICSHGINKLAIEKYIYLNHYLSGINYLILRLSNPFGEYHTSDKHGLINVTLNNIINKKKNIIMGNGEIVRDYIYVKDCAKIIRELIRKNISNQIINVGSGQGHSINEIHSLIKDCTGDFEIMNEDARNFDVPKIVLDTSKLKSLIKFRLTPIEKAICNTYKWSKNKYE